MTPARGGEEDAKGQREVGRLTVDGNGNDLVEDVAIAALEGRDLCERVEFLVVVAQATLERVGVDQLDVEVVRFGDSLEDGGARVTLPSRTQCQSWCAHRSPPPALPPWGLPNIPRTRRACRTTCWRICTCLWGSCVGSLAVCCDARGCESLSNTLNPSCSQKNISKRSKLGPPKAWRSEQHLHGLRLHPKFELNLPFIHTSQWSRICSVRASEER